MKTLFPALMLSCIICNTAFSQNVAINATGSLPDSKAILDISSTTSGLLIPRMTTVQRDAIASPPAGLQVYNTTTNTIDVFRSTLWEQSDIADTTIKNIRSLADLPTPVGSEITLNGAKTYRFIGSVNISPYYINLNGAALIGTSPDHDGDGVRSNVSGAVLRSTNKAVYLEKIKVVPLTSATKAYDFSDATGMNNCILKAGNMIWDSFGTPSLGVGQVSGFRIISIENNVWITGDGIKVTGNNSRFVCFGTLFVMQSGTGTGIEFLAAASIPNVAIYNNQFTYAGQTGIKLNSGAVITDGLITNNIFAGVTTLLSGFDPYAAAWEMHQNTGLANSRAFGFSYMNDNTTSTSLTNVSTYYKIAGATTAINEKRFTATDNRFTYTGKRNETARIFIVVGGKAAATNVDYSIAVAKNGVIVPYPNSSMGSLPNNQAYQITLETELDLVTGDYIEVFIKRNNSVTSSVIVSDLQFRVSDF